MERKYLSDLFVLILIAFMLAACGSSGGDGNGNGGATDTDRDGLNDTEELQVYYTNPQMKDTDGDGLSDGEEIINMGFDPEDNNYLFNPCIAETPRIDINLTSVPDISILYIDSHGTSMEEAVTHSNTTAQSTSKSETDSNSQSVETSESWGVSVTVGASYSFPGWGASAEATASYDHSETNTSEQSYSWTEEQTEENSTTLENMEARVVSGEVQMTGGEMSVTVDIINNGLYAFEITNIVLSSVITTPTNDQIIQPVGNMNFDTTFKDFPVLALGPGQKASGLTFTAGLDLNTTKALLQDSNSLNIEVANYNITNMNNNSFIHDQTAIKAKTSLIIIDFGSKNGRPIERYQVATEGNPTKKNISVGEALTNTLRLPYTTDLSKGGLLSVRGIGTDDKILSHWTVLFVTNPTGIKGDEVANVYNIDKPYDFNNIALKAGDVMQLIYMEDLDLDGLGNRQEWAYGTNPDNPDTDGDGLTDSEEVMNEIRTEPTKSDSDDDGMSDYEEVMVGWSISVDGNPSYQVYSHPMKIDSDGDNVDDKAERDIKTDPNIKDTDFDGVNDNSDPFPFNACHSTECEKRVSLKIKNIICTDESDDDNYESHKFTNLSSLYGDRLEIKDIVVSVDAYNRTSIEDTGIQFKTQEELYRCGYGTNIMTLMKNDDWILEEMIGECPVNSMILNFNRENWQFSKLILTAHIIEEDRICTAWSCNKIEGTCEYGKYFCESWKYDKVDEATNHITLTGEEIISDVTNTKTHIITLKDWSGSYGGTSYEGTIEIEIEAEGLALVN